MAAYIVSGTLNPDVTGTYSLTETLYNGEPTYKCVDHIDEYWLVADVSGKPSAVVGHHIAQSAPDSAAMWQRNDAAIAGEYAPVGEATGTATVGEAMPDTTPEAFSFAPIGGVLPSAAVVSTPAEVTGMDAGTAVSVSGGEYRKNGGAWTSDAGTLDPGDTLELRATSSGDSGGKVTVTATVGETTSDWIVETATALGIVFQGELSFRGRVFRGQA